MYAIDVTEEVSQRPIFAPVKDLQPANISVDELGGKRSYSVTQFQ